MELEDQDPPRRSSNKTLWVILAVIGGVGFVVVAACAGCGFFAFRSIATDIPPAQASADAFLADLQASRVDAAYASTSSTFKSAQSELQFREFVSRFSTFKSQTSHSYNDSRVNYTPSGKRAALKTTLRSADNAMSCTIIVVQDSGQWKVEGVTVP
jgi:hypothetical protein